MKKVLVTGGAGFIGYHLAKNLLTKGYSVDIIDDFSRAVMDNALKDLIKRSNISLINANLLLSEDCSKIKKDYNYIYHLAAIIGVQHVLKAPYQVLSKNFLLLENMLKVAKNQTCMERFIFASTSEVYAGTLKHTGLTFPTPESTILTINDLSDARSSYMLSKIYGEALCLQSGLPVTIVRPHNFYGPRMGMSHVVPELMKKVVESKDKKIEVFSVDHQRTFCFIDDAIEMITLLAESAKSLGEAYNIGNDIEEIKMKELALKIIKLISNKIEVRPKENNSGSPPRRCPDISKLKSIIDYKQRFSLEEGLAKTFEWYKANVFFGEKVSAV